MADSLCNTQFVFCGLEIWGGDLDGDLSCFILRLNDDDGLAAEGQNWSRKFPKSVSTSTFRR